MDKIAVLIPCYNEEKTVAKVIRDAKAALPEAVVYVYDNNSTDRPAQIAEAEGAVVRPEYMQGKGNVIRRMFREIDARCYIMVDGDDTYPMEFAPQMVEKVLIYKVEKVVLVVVINGVVVAAVVVIMVVVEETMMVMQEIVVVEEEVLVSVVMVLLVVVKLLEIIAKMDGQRLVGRINLNDNKNMVIFSNILRKMEFDFLNVS